ncbi:iron ABC transporter permease [Veillonella caviae]|uniref:FecCD family ABC transporter permease n=1 Tax=Veillonella caviae TaxID=248316 RepID=UPI0023F92236|nr:iron ABC transporter permease [Veillonella caviae]MCI7694126.1 iron ABC transporter permease [Veillonella caviae]MDD7290501.1 iron ABC transporter permease [Veillonella caviae]MDY5254230.1 iron ABC transporter permease [Veillonella caviae]MDY5787928.1 iron ABC transporter permease [Veillonella caviae]
MHSVSERKMFRLSVLLILVALLVASMFISLIFGSTSVSLSDIWRTLWSSELTDSASQIIWNIRLPRNIVAALVGACLATSGAILQAVMKNPLADPQIVGVSSGAGLMGVIILILFPGYDYLVPMVAFLGAMGAALMVYALAWKNGIRPSRIILAGVAVSAFLGSGISALLVFFGDRVQGALLWMVGGLAARSWPQVEVLLPYAIVGLIFACMGAKRLTILSLGDETAKGLGLKVEQTRFMMTAVAAMLAAGAVSIAGLIGFVGLVIPHILRLIIGNDYAYLLPGSALLGAFILVISDTVGRVVLSPIEIPVGIIMAFFGAPFFLYLLRRDA